MKEKVQTESSWEHKRSIKAGIECNQVLRRISCDGTWVDHIDTIQDSTKCEGREAEEGKGVGNSTDSKQVSSLPSTHQKIYLSIHSQDCIWLVLD